MSVTLEAGGVSVGQNHAQQARRSSMILGSRKSSSATAVSTLTSSSSMSSSTSASSTCPHTHRQNHNSSKLPTFRPADLLSNSGKPRISALPALQHCAPDGVPNPAPVGPAPGRGPDPATAPEPGAPQGPGQPEGPRPPTNVSDPHQNPPTNPVAAPAHSATAPGRHGRQSVLHSKPQPETLAVAASQSTRLPRTRASTLIPSPAAPSLTPTNNGTSSSTTKNQPVKGTLATKRSSSLPTNPSGVQQHVSPADNGRTNHSSATSPSAPQPSAPAPAPAPSTTAVPQHAEAAPAATHTTITTTTTATPATASNSTASTDLSLSQSQQARRPPQSFSGQPSPNSSASVGTQRRHTFESAQNNRAPADRATRHWSSGSGQRELLLPKSLGSTSSDERSPSASVTRRPPPLSYRPPPSLSAAQPPSTSTSASPTVTTPVRVPPIRSFRSSGSRRSLVIDPASRQRALEGSGDEVGDMDSRDDTLRALEGRSEDYTSRTPPSGSARPSGGDGDDTTDMFLNIAHEESIRPSIENSPGPVEDHGAISRVARSSHRRPLSAAVPSYQPTSPPQVGRRLSDQRETSRTRKDDENGAADQAPHGLPYRSSIQNKAMSAHPGEDLSRRATSSFRSGSTTPRSLAYQEPGDSGVYARRRTSTSDTQRTAPFKHSSLGYGQYRLSAYHSSPLAPRPEPQHGTEYGHGPEGTESTASTTGPSTVWDELDDLKSRISRLELTGKLPSTSGAAMSRVSDERPYTANTTATNVSSSPKRNAGSATNGQQGDASSTISGGQKEAHPVLHAALAKSKTLLGPESYRALEAVATDSLNLLSMVGAPGQPGPISSGASSAGGSGVTDRQLRRKVDSMCRSITELCLALNGEYSHTAPHNSNNAQPAEGPTTPTLNGFSNGAAQRRSSAAIETGALRVTTSPRALSKLEERRNNMLHSSIPSPRLATPILPTPSLAPPAEAMQGRRSSLLLSRRRAGTEEPPDDGRRSSLLLRTRRAGTEEPEENSLSARKPSLLLRPRRGTVGEDDDVRAPSRAATEVAPASRAVSRDHSAPGADPASLTSSALPRRRLHNSPALNSRFSVPSSPAANQARRFGDNNGNGTERPADERNGATRAYSISQTSMLNRTASVSRKPNGDSTMMNSQGTPQVGSYR